MSTSRRWLQFVLAAGILVVGAWILLNHLLAAGGWKRFVSRPLPDGSRFTFLYPAYLRDVSEGPGGSPEVIHSASVCNRSGEHPEDVNRTSLGTSLRRMGLSKAEDITVVVVPLNKKQAVDGRSSAEFTQGSCWRHNEYVVDARSRLQLSLYYNCAIDAAQRLRNCGRISRSLRLLPPGTRAPGPR